jgi:predicted ATP-grasp superfamily ATP-dependent carboligase
MTELELRFCLPAELWERIKQLPYVSVTESEVVHDPELTWKQVHNVAAVVTMVGTAAATPNYYEDIARIISGYAAKQEFSCTIFIDGKRDRHPIEVTREVGVRELADQIREKAESE